jgi:hypothetical protein
MGDIGAFFPKDKSALPVGVTSIKPPITPGLYQISAGIFMLTDERPFSGSVVGSPVVRYGIRA